MGRIWAILLLSAALLSACGSQEEILQGERLGLDGAAPAAAILPDAPKFSAPKATSNASWGHANRNTAQDTGHLALASDPSAAWVVPVTSKTGRRLQITAPPVVDNGRIFVLGSASDVTALSQSGEILWQRAFVPAGEKPGDASGGGITAVKGTVYVTTPFGELYALDAENGDTRWSHDFQMTGISAATASGGLLYLSSRAGAAFAMDPKTGRIKWEIAGPSSLAHSNVVPMPSVTSKWALFPFATGEVLSVFRRGGIRNWTAVVTGRREGVAANVFSDLSGGPLIRGNTAYIGNTAGRLVALNMTSGERRWTATEGVKGRLVYAGNSLFAIGDQNEILRLSANSGKVLWRTALPRYLDDNPRKRDAIVAHYGPVYAGGHMIVASSDAQLRFFDPQSGRQVKSLPMDAAAAAAPIVANGALYVLTTDGTLQAFQ